MESDSDLLIHVPAVYVSWKIKNFSTYKDIFNSESFSLPGKENCKWYISVYPFGNSNDKDYVEIYLNFKVNTENNMNILFKFSLHNESGTCLIESEKSSMCDYSDNYQSWGFQELCKRDEILNLLENDMLDVHCWIKWKTDISIGNKLGALDEIDRLSNLSCGYKKLMDEGSFSDVILEANDGTKFPAHKSILASRSSVFAAMFSHDMKENKESKVEIKDLDEKVLKTMLQYIYSGSFNENDCQINELFEAADKYDLQVLKEWCEDILIHNLNIDNAATYLLLSDHYNSEDLKMRSLDYISKHVNDVLETDSFEDLKVLQPLLMEDILKCLVKKKKY